MTHKQYLRALARLDLQPYGRETADALGLKSRQLARLAVGNVEPSATLALLLDMYLRHGIPRRK